MACAGFELAQDSELAFYQDLNNGGWILSLGPEFEIPESPLPGNIRLIDTGDLRFPYNGVCGRCLAKIGKVNEIAGFQRRSLNFTGKKVSLVYPNERTSGKGAQKWSNMISRFPHIRQITATVQSNVVLVGVDTINFHGVKDLEEMISAGSAVSRRSNLYPRNYQWRSYFFSCFNNVLLCLPTGMGKTLIATMLMKAYHRRNMKKGQKFIVPTVVLVSSSKLIWIEVHAKSYFHKVEQQAAVIERNTGLTVMRRSGEQNNKTPWSSDEICVCTPAMLLNAIKLNQVDMSQQSLLILDEVHEANSPNSPYGLLLPYIVKCPASQRPRVLGLSASPSSSNVTDIRDSISSLCDRLLAIPYTPLIDDNTEIVKSVNCEYVGIYKSIFELKYEAFVIESLEKLSSYHAFFNSNWNKVPFNVSTQNKIDIVVKSLSHSKMVAQNMADLPLFELTQWMRKWIDSLQLLEIFGPRKLMQFIQFDLKFTERNNSLKRITPALVSFAAQMQLTIEGLESDNNIADNSQKLQELLNRLKAHKDDQERILIFVNRRNTAERLCRKLQDEPDIVNMNPMYIVGNSGSNFPKELQQSILEKFSKGECRVLVSTSVLEQGIDVAACGLVICFDGIRSVKSTIQSRGRARKDIANFVAFVASEEQRKANELTQKEISMDYAIRQLMVEYKSAFDSSVHLEIEKFLESDRLTVNENEYSDTEEDDESELLLNMHNNDKNVLQFRFFNYVNSKPLVESLVAHIENFFSSPIDIVKVKSGFIYAKFVVSGDFENDSKIREISSFSTSKKHSRLRTWFDVSYNIPKSDDGDKGLIDGIDFEELRGFYFKDFLSVSYDSNPIWCGTFKFFIRGNEIVLSSMSRHFTIRSIDIDGSVLINDTNNGFEIFLCLRIPPCYFTEKELDHFDFNNNSFNLSIKRNCPIDSKISWNIRSALQNLNIQIYNVCNLRRVHMDYGSRAANDNNSDDFMRNYLIKSWHSTHAAVLPTILPASIISQFHNCGSSANLMLLLNNTKPIRFHQLRIERIVDVALPFPDCSSQSDGYALCGRVKVTPYRYIFTGLEPIPKNRVFRYFPNPNNFLMISFCDETGGNPWRSQNICEWFLNVLQSGIRVGKTYFTFLGCSNSQLREGRCWFSCLDRQVVYDKIGEFPNNWSAGRKLTRIALAFAASVVTVSLDHERYLTSVAPDVEVGNVNFSDGIGRASRNIFRKITKIMDLPQSTSALQIRVGGFKGVVSVYDQEEDVVFRKSMKKFDSEHNMLEVLNYSRVIPLCLNRHVILLLSSFGVPDDVFLEMQHKMLMKNIDTLCDDESSFAFVASNSSIFDWQLFSRCQLVREPFFRQMLNSNVIDLIASITNHSHIPVAKGRVLMGVLDETGTLEYGEVYANIVEETNEFELEGKVVVFRNPCVLPSDIRVLNACNKSKTSRLKKLYQNCLVIPSQGPDSHARECAGGDLDGDLYYVIWDENLIPKQLKVPGEKITEVITEEQKSSITMDLPELASMTQFFCDYVSKNQLGIIANAHLAVSDSLGMRHPQSIQLAKYVAAETDAPKKGLTVGKIYSKILPKTYPDFMQKSDKPMYRSSTILGQLYRQSKPIFEIFLERRSITSPLSKFSFTGDTKSIETVYELYGYEIKTLLQRFDLQSEVDLFSGTPMWREDYMSTHKQQHQLRQTLIENIQQFWKKWKVIFEKWRTEVCNNQHLIMEWYSKPKSSPCPLHSFSFLALPFIHFEEPNRKTLSQKIFESTKRWVYQNKMQWLSEWRLRFNVGQKIMQKLEGIECHYYGSSMLGMICIFVSRSQVQCVFIIKIPYFLGLSEEYSDIDLYTSEEDLVKLRSMLKCLDENATSMKKPHSCVTLSLDSLNIDLTNFIGGVNKTYTIAAILDENPTFWSVLRVLIEWARTLRIVKSCGSGGIMTVVSFCHLFICFATDLPPRMKSDHDQRPYTLKRIGNWIDSVHNLMCGSLIYDFLTFIGSRENRQRLLAIVDPLSGDPLIKSDMLDELRMHSEHAKMLLAVHDGDIRKLFQFCTKRRIFRLDRRYIDPKIVAEERKQQCLKEIKASCNSTKYPNLLLELVERNGLFYVEVIGDYIHLSEVEKGINRIHNKVLSTRYGESKIRHNTFYVSNSSIIIPEFANGLWSEVSFTTYNGDLYTARHTGFWMSRLMYRGAYPNLNWRTTEYQRYEILFLKQIRLFREKREINVGKWKIRRFFSDMLCNIRCGNHYFFNVPETLHNSFETLTLRNVEEKVSHLEEALDLERLGNIINDLKSNDSLTLIKTCGRINDKQPLMLMPLQEMKKRFIEENSKNKKIMPTSIDTKTNGIRHSFYPIWRLGLESARQFATQHGFKEVLPKSDDFYTTISVHWRQREMVIKCDKNGMILEIRHRSTRWLSASFHKSENDGGGDVRTYLECRAVLDDDESCIETIAEYMHGRSIYTESFVKQMQKCYKWDEMNDQPSFAPRPLIPDIFQLNWRFRSMRLVTPVLKFVNIDNDVLWLHNINDGIFHFQKSEFEWFPNHFEFEMRLCMDLGDNVLCKKSYDYSLKLFDFMKGRQPK